MAEFQPFIVTDPLYKVFDEGWAKWVKGKGDQFKDVRWGPAIERWVTDSAADWQMFDLGLAAVTYPFQIEWVLTSMVFPEVKRTGDLVVALKGDEVRWDAQDGRWYVRTPRVRPTPPPPIERPCLADMKKDLAEYDRLFNGGQGTLQEGEWRDLRQKRINECLG